MNYQNKKLYIILFVLCFFVLLISVAFAALSTTLTINFGNVTQTVQTWNVHFTPVNISNPTNVIVPSTQGTSVDSGLSCGNATFTDNVVTIGNFSLSKPDDACWWNIPVKNDGSIDAKLTSLNITSPTGGSSACVIYDHGELVCDDITISFFYNWSPSIVDNMIVCQGGVGIHLDDANPSMVISKNGGYGCLSIGAVYNSSTVSTTTYTLTGTKAQVVFSQK